MAARKQGAASRPEASRVWAVWHAVISRYRERVRYLAKEQRTSASTGGSGVLPKGKSPPSLLLGKACLQGRRDDFLGKNKASQHRIGKCIILVRQAILSFLMISFCHSFMSWFLKKMFKCQGESGHCDAESGRRGVKREGCGHERRMSMGRAFGWAMPSSHLAVTLQVIKFAWLKALGSFKPT